MTDEQQNSSKETHSLFDQAAAAFEAGESLRAESLYAAIPSSDAKFPQAQGNLAVLHQRVGRLASAEKALVQRARALPEQVVVWLELGRVRARRGKFEAALKAFRTAISLEANSGEAWAGAAEALIGLGRTEEARDAAKRAVVLDRTLDTAWVQLTRALMGLCEWADLPAVKRALRRTTEERLAEGLPIALPPNLAVVAFDDPTFQRVVAEAATKEIIERAKSSSQVISKIETRASDGRLTIGYLSGHFGDAPIGYLAEDLFGAHDRRRFRVVGFSLAKSDGSNRANRIKAGFDSLIDISGLSDVEAAATIRHQGVDVLIDLHGYLPGHRADILAHRPAPIAINYLGFPGTTGTGLHDHIAIDPRLAAESEAHFFGEKRINFADGLPVISLYDALPGGHSESKGTHGLGDGPVYCCFAPPEKIGPLSFDLWCAILHDMPGAQLWLLDAGPIASGNLRHEAAKRGIEPERLIFGPPLPRKDHIRRLSAADVGLDTIGSSDGQTVADCLLAGLPFIACTGESPAARLAGSQLIGADQARNITTSPQTAHSMALDTRALSTGSMGEFARVEARARALEAAIERLTADL